MSYNLLQYFFLIHQLLIISEICCYVVLRIGILTNHFKTQIMLRSIFPCLLSVLLIIILLHIFWAAFHYCSCNYTSCPLSSNEAHIFYEPQSHNMMVFSSFKITEKPTRKAICVELLRASSFKLTKNESKLTCAYIGIIQSISFSTE